MGLACVTVLAAVVGAQFAVQGTPAQEQRDQTPRFSTRSEAVRVDVLVTHRGRPVPGLTAADFEVRDEGVVQRIDVIQEEAEPINVICLLDVGQQDATRFGQLVDASQFLIDSLRPDDRLTLVTFGEAIRVLARESTDRGAAKAALARVSLALGLYRTTYDAVFAGLAMGHADSGRTLIVLFSHGWSGGSGWMSRAGVLDVAAHTDAVVYAVTYRYRGITPRDYHRVLDDLADATGGRVAVTRDGRDLHGAFVSALEEFRRRYVLTYTPAGGRPGGWHRLDVTLTRVRADVRARRGYFAE